MGHLLVLSSPLGARSEHVILSLGIYRPPQLSARLYRLDVHPPELTHRTRTDHLPASLPLLAPLSAYLRLVPSFPLSAYASLIHWVSTEAYSCKSVSRERKLFKTLEQAYSLEQAEQDEMLSMSPEMREAGLESCFGRLDQKDSRYVG